MANSTYRILACVGIRKQQDHGPRVQFIVPCVAYCIDWNQTIIMRVWNRSVQEGHTKFRAGLPPQTPETTDMLKISICTDNLTMSGAARTVHQVNIGAFFDNVRKKMSGSRGMSNNKTEYRRDSTSSLKTSPVCTCHTMMGLHSPGDT
ncbi:hypothetical protein TNCV_1460091 [Trichonephila clavipes]|nr:hypothetical protein TNCV_1460091 [Trichonephila clavipes]